MSPPVVFQLVVGEAERRLLRDLLEERITNIEGHMAAIREVPDIAQVADVALDDLEEQFATARGCLLLMGDG